VIYFIDFSGFVLQVYTLLLVTLFSLVLRFFILLNLYFSGLHSYGSWTSMLIRAIIIHNQYYTF